MNCPLCNSNQIITYKGEVICKNCGLVIEDHSCDFYRYHFIKNNNEIIKTKKEERIKVIKLKKLTLISRGYEERVLKNAIKEFNRLTSKLNIPNFIKDEALSIFKKIRKIKKRLPIKATIVASLYAACKIYGIPRTLDEIAKYTKAGRKDVARCYRLLLKEVNIKIPIADPIDFTVRIGSVLNLSGITQHRAAEIIREAKKRGITAGKDPAGLAAAAIYIASLLENERRTQKEIAQAAQVTEVTVRNRYKELMRELKIEIPLQ